MHVPRPGKTWNGAISPQLQLLVWCLHACNFEVGFIDLHSIDFLHQGILLVEAVIKPRAAKPARLTHLLLIQKLRVDRRLAVDQSGTSE